MPFLALFLQNIASTTMTEKPANPFEQNPQAMAGVFVIIAVVAIVALAVTILPCWHICKKAGFSPWLSFLNILPFGSLIYLYIVAFSSWKVIPVPVAYPSLPTQPPTPPEA